MSTDIRLTRRRWLRDTLALLMTARMNAAAPASEETIDFSDTHAFSVDAQSANPRVKYFDLRRLTRRLTPNDEFFVFHQTDVPRVDVATWRLHVAGLIDRPASFTLAELLREFGPERELEVALECSGNVPREHSLNGQVSNARWSGVSLASLLKHCGVKPEVREAVFFGADAARDPGGEAVAPHARSVFIQDALDADALLATRMNGAPLPAEHGFPLRLILPGWYGMAQVKWLTRIELIDRRYEGPHMSRNYHTLHSVSADAATPMLLETSIARTRLKSVVARVTRTRSGNSQPAYRVHGAAWGGVWPIGRVELAVDRGPWRAVRIDESGGRYGWSLWSFDWTDATPGRHTLMSRAIDTAGNVQPPLDTWLAEIKSARENNSQWERVIELRG